MGIKVLHGDRLVDSELLELDKQAKYGDAVSGWRGDETLFVCVQPLPGGAPPQVQVWGLDAHNREYIACSEPGTDGYRHRLLAKLVRGDWQKRAGDLVEETMKANAKAKADRQAQWDDWMVNEFAPKLHHAFVKDGAVPRTHHYIPDGDKAKEPAS